MSNTALSPATASAGIRAALLLTLIYVAFSWTTLSLYVLLDNLPAVYIATGVLWGGLMLLPQPAARVLVVGAFVAQLSGELLVYGSPIMLGIVYSASKVLEAVVGVFLVRRAIGATRLSPSFEHVLKFILIGCLLVPLLFAIPPQIMRIMLDREATLALYFQWAVLQAAGTMLVVPLMVFLFGGPPWRRDGRYLEIIALAVFTAAIFSLVFIWRPYFFQFNSVLYLTFPSLIWAASRFGCRGAAVINLAMAMTAIGSALAIGTHNLDASKLFLSLIELEVFILTSATISLLLGAYAEERERALALQRLNRSRLNALSLRLVENEENYRLKIATLLHDDVGQMLAVSKIRLKLAERALSRAPEMKSELALVAEAIDEAIETTRRMTRDTVSTLYPVGSLKDALEGHLQNICEGLPISFTLHCDELPVMEKSLSTVLSRCARECIINVMKHAQARHITVSLGYDGDALQLDIRDDGRGFDVDAFDLKDPGTSSFGLVSVENAVEALGGTLHIDSDREGTRVTIRVPAAQQHAA